VTQVYDSTVKTVEEYIAAAPAKARPHLRELRRIIRQAAPDASESISYGLAYYSLDGRLIYFGVMRDWAGLYMLGGAKKKYAKELAPYLSGVSTARFPLDKPLPATLVRKIVKLRVEENRASRVEGGRSSPRTPGRARPTRARRSPGSPASSRPRSRRTRG